MLATTLIYILLGSIALSQLLLCCKAMYIVYENRKNDGLYIFPIIAVGLAVFFELKWIFEYF